MTVSTIFALSTPLGRSGLCIFRLSGPKSLEVSKILCGIDLSKNVRKAQYVKLQHQGRPIDSGVACYYQAPKSPTGEDVVEFNLHGSLAVIDQMSAVLRSLRHLGIRDAEKGEFTKRSLFNGKMSLTEVEALGDLLEAETDLQLQIMHSNLAGNIDRKIKEWQNVITDEMSKLEALIEFSETDAVDAKLDVKNINNLSKSIETAILDANVYEKLRCGFEVMILGPPNAGKSSLLNYLAKETVSIVSVKAGTTRDLIKHDLNLNGIPIRIVDSAGLRTSTCDIESTGIQLAQERAGKADLLIVLLDNDCNQFLKEYNHILDAHKTIFVQSKCDLGTITVDGIDVMRVSSVTGEGIPDLVNTISSRLLPFINDKSVISERAFFNSRQKSILESSLECLQKASETDDIVIAVEHLKEANQSLKRIRGEVFDVEEIYDRIFANFCVGK